jgi:pyruvate/2-oxoglutarate dehydrogenase complex dihydrolipoamide acyltransferase (E2) component
MAVEVILPKVDMDMASAKILKWFVGEGEPVKKGAALFEIETDKAAMEIESPADGVLQQLVKEGEIAEIGAAVGFIMGAGEAPVQAAVTAETKTPKPAPQASPPVAAPPPVAPIQVSNGLRATPLARRLAREAGLDIKSMNGSGPRGRIVAEDVRKASEVKPALAAAARQYHLTIACNAASLLALRGRIAAHGRELKIVEFIGKAFAAAAKGADAPLEQRYSIIDLGEFGIEEGTAIVQPSHTAMLVLGAEADGHMRCTLCATSELDHAKAAELLKLLRSFIEDPMLMLA